MLRPLVAVLLLCASLVCQTVRVANRSAQPFAGWVRTTTDTRPPHAAGILPDGTRYALGRRVGLDTWAVDVRVALAATQERTIGLGPAADAPLPASWLPADPVTYFGGWATVSGIPMALAGIEADGAGWDVHLTARTGRTFVVDLWLCWRPEEPWLAVGEATVTSSNPAVPDVIEVVPAGGIQFRFGDGIVFGAALATSGQSFADGQARTIPVVVGWPRLAPTAGDWLGTVPAAVGRTTCAVGIAKLWPGGNPRLPVGFDPVGWTRGRWQAALSVANSWDAAVMGPSKNSSDTGGQQDQVWVAGECLAGVGPEQVAYLSALKLAARPNHFRDAAGVPLDPATKPGIQFFNSRPHPSTGDLLGKSRTIQSDQTQDDTSGWFGPDSQHWLANGLVAATRLTGSRALQAELSQQARLFLWQEALPSEHPGWFTAGWDSARSVGWTMILATHMWQNLEDRPLAERVRARAIARMQQVYVPAFQGHDIWDVRTDDPRLGPGQWWQPWQQSIGAYGLDLAAEQFGVPAARAVALQAAKAVLRDAWKQVGGRWQTAPDHPVAGTAVFNESFNLFGMPLAVATVLRQQPQDATARAIWTQLLADATLPGQLAWLPPEITLAPVVPPVDPPATGATTVSQWGVTWTFASARQVGQFCNGDWWVVGPVSITAIDPPSTVQGGRTVNGSMVNPDMSGAVGYDSTLYANYAAGNRVYVPALNMARTMPLAVPAGSSLVSTISQIGPDPSGSASEIRTAAVLTVLAAAPPADAFRPPYCGAQKTIWRESQLDYTALAHMTPAPGGPTIADCVQQFSRVWLDHCPHWTSGHIHPVLNMPSYYRDFTTWTGTAALRLNCDYPDAAKRDLLVRFVQVGIDWYGQYRVQTEPWGVNGHCNGRKFPILFAGKVLADAAMLRVGTDHPLRYFGPDDPRNVVPWWSEDGQTFHVEQTSPGVWNYGYGGYTAADAGLVDWGNFHAGGHSYDASADSKAWDANSYRRCCSATSWVGTTLAMRAMGLQSAWNWPAHFDYMDRYLSTPTLPGEGWTRAWEPWQAAMWDAHRSNL